MLKTGPVRIWLRANVENCLAAVQITVGEIAGRSEDFVVVGGHQDSWPGPQATDNAAGNACILELARSSAAPRQAAARPGRRLLDRARDGHMIGSSWFVDRNWDRLREHAVAYLQIDQPACAGTSALERGPPTSS
jgi:hypothetical protein